MGQIGSIALPVLILTVLIGVAIVSQNPEMVPALGEALQDLDFDQLTVGTDSAACEIVTQDVERQFENLAAGMPGGSGETEEVNVRCTCTETGAITEGGQQTGEITFVLYTLTSDSSDGSMKGVASVVDERIDTNQLYSMNGEFVSNMPRSYFETLNDGMDRCSLDL